MCIKIHTILTRLRVGEPWTSATFLDQAQAETYYIACVSTGLETIKLEHEARVIASGNTRDDAEDSMAARRGIIPEGFATALRA